MNISITAAADLLKKTGNVELAGRPVRRVEALKILTSAPCTWVKVGNTLHIERDVLAK